ncbi:hypothetical protein ACHAXM_006123 [Skeletonema potamos]|jgi:hypothetical protein
MAPRIANDSFPDHYLTVDYDHGVPMGIGGHPGDIGVDLAAADLGGDMGVAAAANAAAAGGLIAAVMGNNNPVAMGGAQAQGDGNGADDLEAAPSIENDPLSVMDQSSTHVSTHLQTSHSSDSESLLSEGQEITFEHRLRQQRGGVNQFSPASISQNATPSTAFGLQGAPSIPSARVNNMQHLLLRQRHQGQSANVSSNASTASAPAIPMQLTENTSWRTTNSEPPVNNLSPRPRVGRSVARASSFGGFPSPGASQQQGQGHALETLNEEVLPSNLFQPTTDRMNSTTSSLTASSMSSPYRRLSSALQGVAGVASLGNSPDESSYATAQQESYAGAYASPNSGSSTPPMVASLGGSTASPNNSPGKSIQYSPSVLDNTSFPEDDDDFSEDGVDKYTPIFKMDFNGKLEEEDKTMDTTADVSLDDHEASPFMAGHESPGSLLSALSPGIHHFAGSPGSINEAGAFDVSPGAPTHASQPPLMFGKDTSISDLTYYAEKGCIVDVLESLTTPHLKTLGSRMLADYAKMPNRRVAVASNTRILEFVQNTALEIGSGRDASLDFVQTYNSSSWLGREYAVETIRSLTAAEENDRYLMNAPGLLEMLALIARGGPFLRHVPYENKFAIVPVPPPTFEATGGIPGSRVAVDNTFCVASDKARLHACIAIMNLSCGKSNKVEITGVPEILEGMRDVMLGRHFSKAPKTSSSNPSIPKSVVDEARLKATTCIKNLSNADANDAALLGTPGLVETLGYVAEATCHPETGATTCTTHACLALMNLSISKANKNRVFRTPGVMDALMAVITRTASKNIDAEVNPKDPSFEARVKACSALSNLAIGYDNKIPMFNYPGFVESILTVIRTDKAEARTKACSILWSFAAEMKNQVPVVRRGDILPALVSVAKEDTKTEARFKCVAALTLLAESPENAVPLLQAGSLEPLMHVLQEAGPDPTQWRGQTASWCVGFLMNMAQCDDVVPALLQEGIVDLLAPLLSLDHYQSLKAAMAVTFVCQYETGDKTYNLLRQTENVIPKIVGLLHNTLSGRGGSGYKYGVFTLRSSVGCIASLAAGPDFMKERIATDPVFESLLRVVTDFCVDGGTPGAIVGGGRDDTRSAVLAVRALSDLIGHLIPEPGCAAMPFGPVMDDQLIKALRSFELSTHPDIDNKTLNMAHSARIRVEGGKNMGKGNGSACSESSPEDDMSSDIGGIGLSLARRFLSPFPCGMDLHVPSDQGNSNDNNNLPLTPKEEDAMSISDTSAGSTSSVRTFLLTDSRTGRRYVVPCDPFGGRQFNDNRVWCFRRGRWCNAGEQPDSNFQWSDELQVAYTVALNESSQH